MKTPQEEAQERFIQELIEEQQELIEEQNVKLKKITKIEKKKSEIKKSLQILEQQNHDIENIRKRKLIFQSMNLEDTKKQKILSKLDNEEKKLVIDPTQIQELNSELHSLSDKEEKLRKAIEYNQFSINHNIIEIAKASDKSIKRTINQHTRLIEYEIIPKTEIDNDKISIISIEDAKAETTSIHESLIRSTRESIHEQVNELIQEHPELKPLAPEIKANAETLDQIPELRRAIDLEVKIAKENKEPNPLDVIERAAKSLEQGTARQADEIKELAKVSPDGAYVYNQIYKGLSYLPLFLPATKGGLLKHGLSSKLGQSLGLSLNILAGLEKMVDGGVIAGIGAVAGLGIAKDAGVNAVTAIDQKHQLKKADKGQAQIAEIQKAITPDDELEAMKKFAHPTARLLTHDYNALPTEWGKDRENASSNMLEALYKSFHTNEFEKGNFPHRKPVLDFDHGLQGTVDSAVSKTLQSRMGTFSINKKEKAQARLAELKIIDHNFLGRLPEPTTTSKGKDKAVILPLDALQSIGSGEIRQRVLFHNNYTGSEHSGEMVIRPNTRGSDFTTTSEKVRRIDAKLEEENSKLKTELKSQKQLLKFFAQTSNVPIPDHLQHLIESSSDEESAKPQASSSTPTPRPQSGRMAKPNSQSTITKHQPLKK